MILSHDDESIIAQATPKGSGAIAIVRISGLNAVQVATAMSKLSSGSRLIDLPSHTVHLGWITDSDGSLIDQVMFILMHSPKTFTGQDTVEITCHNNSFIIEAVIARAIACGARLAQEGEFTRRSVANNKIDLVQAEAINELIHANTRQALKQSLAQLKGSFSSWIEALEKELLKALALSEASFEFIDEEMEFGTQIATIIAQALITIGEIKKTFDQQQHLRQGFRIALIGSVNAGKSSLFNALLGKQRAIVTHIAGTTRDAIEAGVYRADGYWTLIDTAGLRQTDDVIEQEGIARSLQEAAHADVILLIVDHSRAMTIQERSAYEQIIAAHSNKVIVVHTKADLDALSTQPLSMLSSIQVSSNAGTGLHKLELVIETKLNQLCAQSNSPFLLNKRQYSLILALEHKLSKIQGELKAPIAYELLSYDLNDAIAHLSELTGKTISEQGMDAVFREFCVGK